MSFNDKQQTTIGWIIAIAAIGSMCTLLSAEVVGLKAWAEALTPAFVGKAMAHIGVVIGSFIGGRLIPTSREENARTRAGDQAIVPATK